MFLLPALEDGHCVFAAGHPQIVPLRSGVAQLRHSGDLDIATRSEPKLQQCADLQETMSAAFDQMQMQPATLACLASFQRSVGGLRLVLLELDSTTLQPERRHVMDAAGSMNGSSSVLTTIAEQAGTQTHENDMPLLAICFEFGSLTRRFFGCSVWPCQAERDNEEKCFSPQAAASTEAPKASPKLPLPAAASASLAVVCIRPAGASGLLHHSELSDDLCAHLQRFLGDDGRMVSRSGAHSSN